MVIEKMSPKTKEEKTKKAGVGGGVPIPHEEKNTGKEVKEEEKREEEKRYVLQYNKGVSEEGYTLLKKEGKILTLTKDKAVEIAEKLMAKHVDLTAVRICRIKGDILIPEQEISGRDIVIRNRQVLPPEMRGIIQEDLLDYMDQEEIGSIRNLISEYLRKKEQIEQFSRLAVQRSAFKRNKENVEKLEEIAKKYKEIKEQYEQIKEAWDNIKTEVEEYIEEQEKQYPSISRWLRVEITGTGRTIRRTSGRQRITGGKREVILRFLRDNRDKRFTEKEIREQLKQRHQEYSWSQQSTWAPLKSLREEGIIAQDEQGRYYLP